MEQHQLSEKIDCWNNQGIYGDRSCAELNRYIHCKNCPAIRNARLSLFQREISPDYRQECLQCLNSEEDQELHELSLFVFRLYSEWFALKSSIIQEVIDISAVHRIPFRSNNILKGLTNVHGKLQLCVSLYALFQLNTKSKNYTRLEKIYNRMIFARLEQEPWVFAVDEIQGIIKCSEENIQPRPTIISKALSDCIQGIFRLGDQSIIYLDERSVWRALARSIQP